MKSEKWIEGINLCIDNIERLKKDGEILRDNDSYGHAFFSFYTAMEEMAIASYMLKNIYTPNPKELNKFIKKHRVKGPLGISKVYKEHLGKKDYGSEFWGDISKLHRKFMKINHTSKEYDFEFNKLLGKKIQKSENLWYLRNRGIYIDLSKDLTHFLGPQDIKQEKLDEIHKLLGIAIDKLKGSRDSIVRDFYDLN